MKNLIKRILNYFNSFFTEENKVEEVIEKTPLDKKRELIAEAFGHEVATGKKGDRMGDVLDGVARGTLVLERMTEKERISAEEEFKLRLFEDIYQLINKHFDDETGALRKEIDSLKDTIKLKDRELEVLKNIKEVLV